MNQSNRLLNVKKIDKANLLTPTTHDTRGKLPSFQLHAL